MIRYLAGEHPTMLDHTMGSRALGGSKRSGGARSGYRPPSDVRAIGMAGLLESAGRAALAEKQLNLLRADRHHDVELHFSGDLSLIDRPCVAVVGSRAVTAQGKARTRRLARELVAAGFTIVSGLAAGVDAAAHEAAIAAGGHTIGVIGTPLNRAYPAENAKLQEEIYQHHLLISPFANGEKTFKSSFPKRNRVMAALSDATVIMEASDTSGSLHQAAECVRLGRWLFIAKSLAENGALTWPAKFLDNEKTAVLSSTNDIVERVLAERP